MAETRILPTKQARTTAGDVLLGRTTGAGAVEEITCTTFARTLLDDADAAAARTTLGISASSSGGHLFNWMNLG